MRTTVAARGFEPTSLTFNGGAHTLATLGNTDVSDLTFQTSSDEGAGTIKYTFPSKYNFGNSMDGKDASNVLRIRGSGTVKIKVAPKVSHNERAAARPYATTCKQRKLPLQVTSAVIHLSHDLTHNFLPRARSLRTRKPSSSITSSTSLPLTTWASTSSTVRPPLSPPLTDRAPKSMP